MNDFKRKMEEYYRGFTTWNSLPGSKIEDEFAIKYCSCHGEIPVADKGKTKYGPYHRKCGLPILDEE